ncbi:MAG TPA: SRPBCC family protein [Chloroflexota bacterium]|jgi:uncharacterized protein YndB with AHSA1/START domain
MVQETSGANTFTMTSSSDREIVMTRVFDAPRELVFEAHSKPEHVSKWWGPRGTSLWRCDMDFRPGGAWRYVVQGADGTENPFKGVFREILPPEKIVWTFIYDVEPYTAYEIIETMSFTEHEGKTTLTTRSVFPSVEIRDGMIASGMEQGSREAMDRLEEHLRTMA